MHQQGHPDVTLVRREQERMEQKQLRVSHVKLATSRSHYLLFVQYLSNAERGERESRVGGGAGE